MSGFLHKTWYSPVLSTILANRTEGLALAGVGGVQLGLHLLDLPGWTCPFKAAFGIPCPGCGLTIAIDELVHGRILNSLHIHAFAPIFLVALALILAAVILPEARRKQLAASVARMENRTGISAWVLSTLMLYWIVRLFGLS